MMQEINIPKKSLFKLDEVCSLTGVKPYVLRFWESEFDEISPILSSTGQKLFEHKDIEAVLIIKNLLFNQKMTIEAAKSEVKNFIGKNRLPASNSKSENISDINLEQTSVNHSQSDAEEGNSLTNSHASLSSSMLVMQLDQKDLIRLTSAKEKLSNILSKAKAVKTRYNWI